MSDPKQERNRPRIPARPPSDRHYLNRLTAKTRVNEQNTLIGPAVNVRADIEAINDGRAVRLGELFLVNGRTYQQEPDGIVFPVAGSGIYTGIRRGVMYALHALARYNGPTPEAEYEIFRHPAISPEDRERAIELWQLRTKQPRTSGPTST